ncbi:MAG: hypothetical protein H7317_00600 [Pseudorhodobacter sp.]|nr:hypothetical protein [Pseudorhodobacter sp.]
MKKPSSVQALTDLGRVRLSKSFFMRDFLYSEIGNFDGIPNFPDDPDVAIAAGTQLCENLLEPLQDTFGRISIRSAFRSADLNGHGNAQMKDKKKGYNCAENEKNFAGHIWDRRDNEGNMGATACIVVPWFADQYEKGRDWRDLAWWVHDHLPYSSMYFFPVLAAFNLNWQDKRLRTISFYIAPKGLLLRQGQEPDETMELRAHRYSDFPAFKGQL